MPSTRKTIMVALSCVFVASALVAAGYAAPMSHEKTAVHMTYVQSIAFGIVEGVTEFLPVSSTGHLCLLEKLFRLDEAPLTKSAVDAYLVVIQFGAMAAVVGLYWRRVRQIARGVLGRDSEGRRLAIRLGAAFLPAAALGTA